MFSISALIFQATENYFWKKSFTNLLFSPRSKFNDFMLVQNKVTGTFYSPWRELSNDNKQLVYCKQTYKYFNTPCTE